MEANAERMPPLSAERLDEKQRRLAEELTNGPRGGVKGPFIALLRTPALLEPLGKVGEYLRFGSHLEPRISELVMLIVAREWTNQFEWAVHVPLARKAGVKPEVIESLSAGRFPNEMAPDEALAYRMCDELSRTKGVCDATYREAVERFGEPGVIDLIAVYGYFVTVCALMNVARTPPPGGTSVPPLERFPQ